MNIIGKITTKTTSEKGLILKIEVMGCSEQDKGVLELLDKWASIQQELKFAITEDVTQTKLDTEEKKKK